MKRVMTLATLVVAACLFSPLYAQTTDPSPYCDGSFDDGGPIGMPVADQINVVTFGDLNNASNAQAPGNHYIYYNNLSRVNYNLDSAYTLSVSMEVHGLAGFGVWIDFNGDGTFSAEEKVMGTTSQQRGQLVPGDTTITQTITIPASADTGKTRMRVRIVEDDNYIMGSNGADILPCNEGTPVDTMDWGETEDYDVYIVAPDEDTSGGGNTGISETTHSSKISIYPNPVHNTLRVKNKSSENAFYTIYNLTGETVKTANLNQGKSIDVSSLNSGVYFIRFKEGRNAGVQYKFLKLDD